MKSNHRITSDSVVDLTFHLKWKSSEAVHTEVYQANRVNIWRDRLPAWLLDVSTGKGTGERLQLPFDAGELVQDFSPQKILNISKDLFRHPDGTNGTTAPRIGRFYPKGLLRGVAGVYRANIQPFRCVGLSDRSMTADLNHPLSGHDLDLSAEVGEIGHKRAERGETSIDWLENLTAGPGMQARWQTQPTDFFSDSALDRDDNHRDAEFYRKPRFVGHLDATARKMVENTYSRFLEDGMQVLDLMGSWQSHIPSRLHLKRFTGLGLNEQELKKNPQLSDYTVHDLNADVVLPFDSSAYDAVINTVSVEYLTDPLSIFREVARILQPNGCFVVTFSNRWFPTKAIKIWREIHEFERMGLVLEYFLRAGGYKDLHTYSIRGLPRPVDDKYFPELLFSDPIYAVWARKI